MADSGPASSATNIAWDDITTRNGSTVTVEQAQRIKVGYGADSFFRDVDFLFPLPTGNSTNASGTLSATDAVVGAPVGDGTLVTGASTAGSIVAIVVPNGMIAWTMMLKGYVSGTIYTEASTNSTNGTDGDWVEVKGRRTGTAPGTESVVYAMVSNGYYRGNCAGFTYLRARLIGGTGPTIRFDLSNGQGATFLNSGIPAGSSAIGTVGVTGSVAVTGTFFQATQPVSLTTLPALVAGAAVIGAVTQSGTWNVGSITTLPALAAGANSIGTVVSTPTTPTAATINSAATTNATSVKASAGTLYSITVSNVGAAAAFLKIYNSAAAPTVGTTTIALTIPVPASGVVNIPFGTQGMRLGTGIALAITNLVADADATVIAAGQVKVLVSYI